MPRLQSILPFNEMKHLQRNEFFTGWLKLFMKDSF